MIFALFKQLPIEIIKLIKQHFFALRIQTTLKLNRPLTALQIGDRIMIKRSILNNLYGTIIEIRRGYSKIKLLPRLIPNWKKCNINFWRYYESILLDYKFTYYTPKILRIKNCELIKLHNWKVSDVNTIDNAKRLELYQLYFRYERCFDNINTTNMFRYLF